MKNHNKHLNILIIYNPVFLLRDCSRAIWVNKETISEWLLFYVAFCTFMAMSRQKEAQSRDYDLPLFRMTSRVIYSVQYHR